MRLKLKIVSEPTTAEYKGSKITRTNYIPQLVKGFFDDMLEGVQSIEWKCDKEGVAEATIKLVGIEIESDLPFVENNSLFDAKGFDLYKQTDLKVYDHSTKKELNWNSLRIYVDVNSSLPKIQIT